MSNLRYQARRENGSDWCVIDTRMPGQPQVITGLENVEAHETADQWNKLEKLRKDF